MNHQDMMNELRFDPPQAGWITCWFSTEYSDWGFNISDAVNDPLAMFMEMLNALRQGKQTPVVELFLEPDWLMVSYDREREELVLAHKLADEAHVCVAKPDELAYFIWMGLKRLKDECSGKLKGTDWSYPLPDLPDEHCNRIDECPF